ncbi:MAG: hypothetical protein GX289_10955 [Tissierellia bacterium]|mgnify:CR=1 FL=1|nr:hypothetical protein [Tissierellia bacterium]
MNIIKNYLDNMFLGLPETEDVKRAKKELLAMMEDKYNELKNSGKTENEAIGIVISEFGNLDELAETLGIKQALENKSDIIHVTYEEAEKYIEDSKNIAPKTALGVFLCIMSPTLLLLLLGLRELDALQIKEDRLIAAGLTALIALVAAGVSYFIRYSSILDKYEYLQKSVFELDYSTEQAVRSAMAQDEHSYKSAVNTSVILYILSILPIFLISLLLDIDGASTISVAVTLTIVAYATYNLINKGGINNACQVLLQQGDYSIKTKSNKTLQTISKVYWLVIVAVYLTYSFITQKWGISWIIWPIAGILYVIIKTVAEEKQ